MADPYKSDDLLPHGTPIEGWGGTFARDHNAQGLYLFGPLPAEPGWVKRLGRPAALEEPLPPDAARSILPRAAKIAMTVKRRTVRQALGLKPLVLGKRRYSVAR
jgi:hypothetical protein